MYKLKVIKTKVMTADTLFKNFCSSRNSLHPTLRHNLRHNSDDGL